MHDDAPCGRKETVIPYLTGSCAMARLRGLMKTVPANLNGFLRPIGAELSKPEDDSLRNGIIGLVG